MASSATGDDSKCVAKDEIVPVGNYECTYMKNACLNTDLDGLPKSMTDRHQPVMTAAACVANRSKQ